MNLIRHLIATIHRAVLSWTRGKRAMRRKERQLEFDFTVRAPRVGRRMP
jgi:hypothetical protein